MKRPAFQFYPADWLTNLRLRACSVAARGMWIDMLCLAHKSERYGHLVVAGCPMTDAQVVASVNGASRELLAELEVAGVFSRDRAGAIFSRRMVRDERLREVRAAGGILGAAHGVKGGRPPPKPLAEKVRGGQRGFANNPPSSSSSSSTSKATSKPTPTPPLPAGCLVSAELWEAFRETRRNLKAKQTAYAENLLVRELARLQAQGQDPTAVVEQSVRCNWKDVYPVGHKGKPTTAAQQRAEWADFIEGNAHGQTIDGTSVRDADDDVRAEQDGQHVGRLRKG